MCRLFFVSLSVCLFTGIVTTERTCGTDFVDVGSSALLAPIVVEGRARRVVYETGEPSGSVTQSSSRVKVIFDRLRFYKGQLTESDGDAHSIEVGDFGIGGADREACVAPVPNVDRPYVLFLRHNDSQIDAASTNFSSVENDARRRRGRGYRLSAFPVRKSRRNIATVVEYTTCSRCGMYHCRVKKPRVWGRPAPHIFWKCGELNAAGMGCTQTSVRKYTGSPAVVEIAHRTALEILGMGSLRAQGRCIGCIGR